MKRTTTRSKSESSTLVSLRISILLFILIVLLVLFFLPRSVEALVTSHLTKTVGLPLKISSFEFNPFDRYFTMGGVQFSNPEGFPDAKLAELGEVTVVYSRRQVLLGHFQIRRARLTFKEFRLVRNAQGKLNLPSVSSIIPEDAAIEELILNLDSVTYTDLTGEQPVQKTFDLGLKDATYRSVKGVAGIIEIINWEILKRTGIDKETPSVLPVIEPAASMPQATLPSQQP